MKTIYVSNKNKNVKCKASPKVKSAIFFFSILFDQTKKKKKIEMKKKMKIETLRT